MSRSLPGNNGLLYIHRTAVFDRTLEQLRRKGGSASLAAENADKLIDNIARGEGNGARKQFRFTRNGERRIKYCMKYSLMGGYRLVFLRKESHIVFLYVGSHDDCCRWIERNKGLTYCVDDTTHALRIQRDDSIAREEIDEELDSDDYEASLMSKIDDKILSEIFSGFIKG
jgi:hypothetical protein